ncbi:ketopantoate reductase family protein [Paenibacillus sp. CAU 1782]
MLRIHIMGGGAIGLLLGSRMALGGSLVTVWTRTREQAELLNREGIRLQEASESGHMVHIARVNGAWMDELAFQSSSGRHGSGLGAMYGNDNSFPAFDIGEIGSGNGDENGRFHWLLLTVKQTHLGDELLKSLRLFGERAGGRAGILCLQNGIGHLQKIVDATDGKIPVYAAVTAEGARRTGLNEVLHTGNGGIWIGDSPENGQIGANPCDNQQKMLLDALCKAGFSSFLSNEIHNRIFHKLLINSVINPLTALFDVSNGELPKHTRRLELMKGLHAESQEILIAAGMEARPKAWEELLAVCGNTSQNISSMLSDVRNGKETEIQSINGAILSLGNQYGKPAPLNRAVTDLIAALAAMS